MKYEQLKLGEVLRFWFEELTPGDWFESGEELDSTIKERFADIHVQVAAGEFWQYRTVAHAYLAEVIVLDQFSRQMFRGEAKAFAFDDMALTLAQEAITKGYDNKLSEQERHFLYMPFMHSESKAIHQDALPLFESLENKDVIKYELKHKAIIDQFGRYPHRNKQLGRKSTPEEIEYLENNQEVFFAS